MLDIGGMEEKGEDSANRFSFPLMVGHYRFDSGVGRSRLPGPL